MAKNITIAEIDALEALPEPTNADLQAIEAELQTVDLNDPTLTAAFSMHPFGLDSFDDLTTYG